MHSAPKTLHVMHVCRYQSSDGQWTFLDPLCLKVCVRQCLHCNIVNIMPMYRRGRGVGCVTDVQEWNAYLQHLPSCPSLPILCCLACALPAHSMHLSVCTCSHTRCCSPTMAQWMPFQPPSPQMCWSWKHRSRCVLILLSQKQGSCSTTSVISGTATGGGLKLGD